MARRTVQSFEITCTRQNARFCKAAYESDLVVSIERYR